MMLLTEKLPNYTSVYPMYELDLELDEAEKIEYAKQIFNRLNNNGNPIIVCNHPKKNFKLAVYQFEDKVYFLQCLKLDGACKNNLYVATDSHKEDFVKICKYLERLYYNGSTKK